MSQAGFIDELERDLGMPARHTLILNAGGQRRFIPSPDRVQNSAIAEEFGYEIAFWLAGRFGGVDIEVPSRSAIEANNRASQLRAAVLEAGLTDPTRTANDIADEFDVSRRRVLQIRSELKADQPAPSSLPLFGDV